MLMTQWVLLLVAQAYQHGLSCSDTALASAVFGVKGLGFKMLGCQVSRM